MATRDQGNGRVKLALGTSTAIADLSAPTAAEANALLDVSEAVRWDGFDFGVQESEQIDDRSVADKASAQLRGFAQFGGAVPFFHPKIIDTGSILRQTYNVIGVDNSDLVWLERIGEKDWSEPFAAGDDVNAYRVLNDGFQLDTEGDGGYAYIVNFLPKGEVYAWTKIAGSTLAAVGALAVSLDPGDVALRGVKASGDSVTARATWSSDNDSIASVSAGVIVGRNPGTTTVTATFPGATGDVEFAVTVGGGA